MPAMPFHGVASSQKVDRKFAEAPRVPKGGAYNQRLGETSPSLNAKSYSNRPSSTKGYDANVRHTRGVSP